MALESPAGRSSLSEEGALLPIAGTSAVGKCPGDHHEASSCRNVISIYAMYAMKFQKGSVIADQESATQDSQVNRAVPSAGVVSELYLGLPVGTAHQTDTKREQTTHRLGSKQGLLDYQCDEAHALTNTCITAVRCRRPVKTLLVTAHLQGHPRMDGSLCILCKWAQ